jgi:hypothetical protein
VVDCWAAIEIDIQFNRKPLVRSVFNNELITFCSSLTKSSFRNLTHGVICGRNWLTTRLNNRPEVAQGRAITDLEFSWERKLTRVLEKLAE